MFTESHMLTKTLARFKKLPKTTKALVYLYGIYAFGETITEIFLNVFVFVQTQSLMSLVLYNCIFLTGVFVGFVIWGYVISQVRISLRFNYLRAFSVNIISFLILLFCPKTFPILLIFAAINGLGVGIFWVGKHAYELIHTDNTKNRDFYTSMVSTVHQVLIIIAPLVATASFILSEKVFHIETFQLLFIILPFTYLLALPYLFRLPYTIPAKINGSQIKRLFFDKKLRRVRQFYAASSSNFSIRLVIIPIIALFSLGTVTNIGILEIILGVIAVISTIILSHIRHENNRVNILLYSTMIHSAILCMLFFFQVSPYIYIIYSLILVITQPLASVSLHSLALRSVELMKDDHITEYAGLLYRDFVLWIGRILVLLLIAFVFYITGNEIWAIQFGILLLAIGRIFTWWTAKRMMNY